MLRDVMPVRSRTRGQVIISSGISSGVRVVESKYSSTGDFRGDYSDADELSMLLDSLVERR